MDKKLEELNDVIEGLIKEVDFKFEKNLDQDITLEELLLLAASLMRSRYPDDTIDAESLILVQKRYNQVKLMVASFYLVLTGEADIDVIDGELMYSLSKPKHEEVIEQASENFLDRIKGLLNDPPGE